MADSDLRVLLLRVEERIAESRRIVAKTKKLADDTVDQARRSLALRFYAGTDGAVAQIQHHTEPTTMDRCGFRQTRYSGTCEIVSAFVGHSGPISSQNSSI